MLHNQINLASASSNAAQRNWDHSACIPQKDIDCLVQTILNAPTKQNETHYKVYYTTDKDLIYKIYHKTRHFTVTKDTTYTDSDGKTLKEHNVRNSQVNANLLFAFCDDWIQDKSRSMIHLLVEERDNISPDALIERETFLFSLSNSVIITSTLSPFANLEGRAFSGSFANWFFLIKIGKEFFPA